jgi:hypothetical protein
MAAQHSQRLGSEPSSATRIRAMVSAMVSPSHRLWLPRLGHAEQPSSATRIRAMVSDSDPSHGQRHRQSPAVEHDVRGTLEAEETLAEFAFRLSPSTSTATRSRRTPPVTRRRDSSCTHSAYRVRTLRVQSACSVARTECVLCSVQSACSVARTLSSCTHSAYRVRAL